MSRLVQLVADYGPDDLAYAELVQRLQLAVPDAVVQLTPVAPADTVAAGFCVARLALTEGPPDRVVAHDVGAAGAGGERLCAGCTRHGVWIVGANTGWSWSFAVDELAALFHVDVTTGGPPPGLRDGLPVAIGHLIRRHPHAIWDAVPRSVVPSLPERVVAHVEAAGDITTTIAELPGAVGTRLQIRIGRVSARAIVAGAGRPVPEGELALAPGASGWPTHAGGRRRFVDVVLGGGSAAERFARPSPGTAVGLRPATGSARARRQP